MEREQAWKAVEDIVDPEIPVVTLVDMHIIRDLEVTGDSVRVIFTPTFVGCPALDMMKKEIRGRLEEAGFREVRIDTVFSPPWSTDLVDEAVREKLRSFGIAPPPVAAGEIPATLELPVPCPHCSSSSTTMESRFGPTLCRQIYYCNNCRQSFERFKPV
jgi:ring-1,2-phenylacetyl-CoA epoxidase subunit PaaD